MIYRNFARALPDVEVCAVELPGRWARSRETPYSSLAQLVDDLLPVLNALPPKPLALFGYSFGAMVAFELAQRLERAGAALQHLFVAACQPPNPSARPRTSHLDDEGLIAFLRDVYGAPLPPALLNDPEMRALILRCTRADLLCLETYAPAEDCTPLKTPITAFASPEDRAAPPAAVAEWAQHTAGASKLHTLPGGHFFIHDQEPALLELLRSALG